MIDQYLDKTIAQMKALKKSYEEANGVVEEYERFNSKEITKLTEVHK